MTSKAGAGTYIALAIGLVIVAQCAEGAGERDKDAAADQISLEATREASTADAEAAALSAVEGTTYADQGRPYGCTDDCSGHDAGYEWAQENGVTDPGECGGNSASFIEGCASYAEAYQAAYEDAAGETPD